MPRYIDADKIPYSDFNLLIIPAVFAYKEDIDKIPTADVAPVVHAHWYTYPDDKQFKCSNCKTGVDLPTLYCPNCGAKMDEMETKVT